MSSALDDSHAVGFMGDGGRGTHEHCGVMGRVDVIAGTLGKALGGASGGYTSGSKEVIGLLRQRSRPYLFSNTIAPPIVAGSIKAIELTFAKDLTPLTQDASIDVVDFVMTYADKSCSRTCSTT